MMNYYLPQYAGGGIAGLASQGRGGDTMLVHMSPQEVMDLQKVARSQGTTMTINPVTGLPEALNLRKALRGIATLLPVAAAFIPGLGAALPFLTTPMGAAVAGGVAGSLSGEKGVDLKRGLMSGLLSYGIGSAMQGLQAAGAADAGSAAGDFTAGELAKMSPQAQAAIASAPAGYGSIAAPGTEAAAAALGAQEAGIAGIRGVSGAPVASAVPMGSASQGISNLFSSDAATRAAAQKAFGSQVGRGALMAGGLGFLGTAALDEQERAAKAALEAGKISQAKYDDFMKNIRESQARAQYTMTQNPWRYAHGGAIDYSRAKRFDDGGGTGDGDAGGDAADSGGDTSGAAADDAAMGAAMSGMSDSMASTSDLGSFESAPSIGPGIVGLGTTGLSTADMDAQIAETGAVPGIAALGSIGPSMADMMADSQAIAEMSEASLGASQAAPSVAAASPGEASAGDSGIGSLMPPPVQLLSLLSDKKEKTYAEMTPEEQNMARIKAIMAGGWRYAVGGEISDTYSLTTPELGGKPESERNVFGLKKGGVAGLPPRYIDGHGDGMSDSVPAMISNRQPARLADGEFVIPADVVSHLGNGSSKAGAKQLYSMMDRVRKARTGNPRQGKEINASRMMPA
jgi:hypothetical protein